MPKRSDAGCRVSQGDKGERRGELCGADKGFGLKPKSCKLRNITIGSADPRLFLRGHRGAE